MLLKQYEFNNILNNCLQTKLCVAKIKVKQRLMEEQGYREKWGFNRSGTKIQKQIHSVDVRKTRRFVSK